MEIILKKVKIYWIVFLLLMLSYVCFINNYFIMTNDIYFDEFIVETCKVSLNLLDDKNVLYDDFEFVVFYEKTDMNISCLNYFNDWVLLNNPRRCFLYLNGAWLNGEMINGYFIYNGVKLNFRLLITYQDTDKYLMHTKDNIFPLLLNLDKVEFLLKIPFKKWSCDLSIVTFDLEKLIDIYNNIWKVKKTVFILSEDKTNGQVLFLKEDYWKKYFDYTKIFKERR